MQSLKQARSGYFAMLGPAIPATLVYSQAELLCFATIVWAIHMFVDRGRPILAGVIEANSGQSRALPVRQ